MFEDSLLIIKSDYLHKRKPILLKLQKEGFQIQANRRLRFTPEQAAEFYQADAEDKFFMLFVIMLSKGNSEAFIVTKENAVEELMNTMVCYFCSSCEMERNVHVSRTKDHARREIKFIYPNYIHEPIASCQNAEFANSPFLKDMITEVCDIISGCTGPPQNWKAKLAEWLTMSNKTLPRMSNQSRPKPLIHMEDKATSVSQNIKMTAQPWIEPHEMLSHSLSFSSGDTSMMMTSSSCVTCTGFDGAQTCYIPAKKKDSIELLVKAKTMRTHSSTSASISEQVHHVCDEQSVDWLEIIEDDDGAYADAEDLDHDFDSKMDTDSKEVLVQAESGETFAEWEISTAKLAEAITTLIEDVHEEPSIPTILLEHEPSPTPVREQVSIPTMLEKEVPSTHTTLWGSERTAATILENAASEAAARPVHTSRNKQANKSLAQDTQAQKPPAEEPAPRPAE